VSPNFNGLRWRRYRTLTQPKTRFTETDQEWPIAARAEMYLKLYCQPGGFLLFIAAMVDYKNHRIYGIAIPRRAGKLWNLRGHVFEPERPRELKRLECPDLICTSSKQAERYALQLCKVWVDRNRTH
jgi:hypothetical protein